MLSKRIITVYVLAFFAHHNDASYGQRRLSFRRGLNGFIPRNFEYACPKPTKEVSSEISSDPLQLGTDYQNDGKLAQHFDVFPVATRLFKILDMAVLPSREVCVSGEKLRNFILPQDLKFETMFSIAIFCISCIQEELQSKRSYCLEQKLRYIVSAYNMKFKSLD